MGDGTEEDDEFLEAMPPGFQFQPRDDELILHYLALKINGKRLPRNRIRVVDFYAFDPHTLANMYKPTGKDQWYFFTSRKKKYKNGSRPDRAAADGYWRASGSDQPIKHRGEQIGSKRSLVYFRAKTGKQSIKTDWLMTEFQAKIAPPHIQTLENNMMLDWVICRISKTRRTRKVEREADDEITKEAAQETDPINQEIHNPNSRASQYSGPQNPIVEREADDEITKEAAQETDPINQEIHNPNSQAGQYSGPQNPIAHFPSPSEAYQPLDAPAAMGFVGYENPAVGYAMPSFDHQAGLLPGFGSEVAFDFQPGLASFGFTGNFSDDIMGFNYAPQMYFEQPSYNYCGIEECVGPTTFAPPVDHCAMNGGPTSGPVVVDEQIGKMVGLQCSSIGDVDGDQWSSTIDELLRSLLL